MIFVHPGWLWLSLVIVPLVALHRQGRMGLGKPRAVVVAAVRVLAVLLLVAALARPVIEPDDPSTTTVIVADVSASVPASELIVVEEAIERLTADPEANERIKLVVFDRTARDVEDIADLGDDGGLGGQRTSGAVGVVVGSALAEALELAGALIPHDGRGRVRLFSDGLETGGDGLAAVHELAARGIRIDVTAIGPERSDEVVLCRVAVPASASIGETVTVQAEVEASSAVEGRLVVQAVDDDEDTVVPCTLVAGRQWVTCRYPLAEPGLTRLTVRIGAAVDAVGGNNELAAAIAVGPPAEVRVVEDDPAAPAAVALAALLGPAGKVTSVSPADLAEPGDLAGAEVLVLADTPAEALGLEVQRAIHDAVVAGTGLLVTGGRRSYGPGGYADTALAEVLPVRFSQRVERRDPSATLVVIIDTSGSMGGPRVNLAKEIARLSIARLKPHDKVGVVEFYGSKRWAAPIQPASNAIDIQRALNRLSAGGGTVILPAIEEAYYALQNVRTRTKHVLVLTDGGVETGAFEPLIRKMAEHGITLSTVLVGPGGHSAFLASLAQWGRGRFYAAPDRFNLPEIILKQPESSLLTPFVEQPSNLAIGQPDPVTAEADWTAAPQLEGYVETEAAATADVLLASNFGHPILARWQYGLGQSAALTTQLGGPWSAQLMQWPAWSRLMSNLIRSLKQPAPAAALAITPILRPGALELQIDDRLPGASSGFSAVMLSLTNEEGTTRQRTLDPIRAHEWNARLAALPAGTWRINARAADGSASGTAAVAVPPPREVTAIGPDRDLLNAIAARDATAARRADDLASVRVTRPQELWPGLALATLILLLVNVLIRRWPVASAPRGVRTANVLPAVLAWGLAWAATAQAQMPVASAEQSPPAPSAEMVRLVDEALSTELAADADVRFDGACRVALERDGSLAVLIEHLRWRQGDDDRAALLLARAACQAGRLDLARETLTPLTERDSVPAAVWAALAVVEELSANDPAALSALGKAIGLEEAADRKFALGIRQALLAYDSGEPGAGSDALLAASAAVKGQAGVATYCAHLASLHDDYDTALSLLAVDGEPKARFHGHLFRGLWLMRLERPGEARAEFEQACAYAPLARDRRFALERVIAATRADGGLEAMATRWLDNPQLPADRLVALVEVLRELERSDDALALLRRPASTPEQVELMHTPEFQQSVVAVAVEAGREQQAEAVYRGLLEREPDRVEWLSSLARLLLLDGRRDEAGALFQEAVARVSGTRTLMTLARAARDLSLDEPATAAAERAVEGGVEARLQARLFQADLARLRGRSDEALSILRGLSDLADEHTSVLLQTAEAFERHGDKIEALGLFRKLHERTGAEDALLRLGWLLEENERFAEAQALWKDLWSRTDVPARLRQAQERLLDLASRTGTLADLAIELEEKLDEGELRQREASLLVDIYTLANDPVSAAEILHEVAQRSGDRLEMLKRLARVYLSCEQFGRCNAVLRRLAVLDPDNAADYLQQIALVALERRQPYEAREALAELEAAAGNAEVADEFAAGILAMLELHDEAARSYARILARHPDRIEAFLLWGNATRAAGRNAEAITRFQVLAEEARQDDLFTIAIDGLLNLDAPPAALRSALRRVYARIAAKPQKVFLYRLAADLLDTLGETQRMRSALEQAVVVAGERRSALLRELMEGARSEGAAAEPIAYGRSLVALGDEVPPQVFLDLGEAMIKQGELAAAARVFERAARIGDYSAIQQRVASYYESADQPATADRLIRELLVAQPDSVPLLIRSGGLGEQLGRFERAFDQYYRSIVLMLNRLPGLVGTDEWAADPVASDQHSRRRYRAVNLDEIGQFLTGAGVGLLNAARNETLRARLLQDLEIHLAEELAVLDRQAVSTPTISRNPRLERLASFAREAAFTLNAPDLADRIDAELLARYKRDEALRTTVVQSRLDWGLYGRAQQLAAGGDEGLPAELRAVRLLGDAEALAGCLDDGDFDPELARRVLPLLIVTGREEQARELLSAVSTDDPAVVIEAAPTMIAVAVALDDPGQVQQWADAWLDGLRSQRDAKGVVSDIEACLDTVWHHLTEDARRAMLGRLARLFGHLCDDDRLRLETLRWRAVRDTGWAEDEFDGLPERMLADASVRASTVALVLESADAADRPALLRAAVNARKPGSVRALLMELAGALHGPHDDAFADTFEGLFRGAPQQRLRPDRMYSELTRGGWYRNRSQPQLGYRIGEILLAERPGRVEVLTVVAVARATAGRYDQAVILAQEAIEALAAKNQPDFADRRMLDALAEIMRSEELLAAASDLEMLQEIDGTTPMLLLARGTLIEAADQTAEAAELYRRAFELMPDTRAVSLPFINLYERAGRDVELSRLLAAHLKASTIMESYSWRILGEACCRLYDTRGALRAARRNESPLAPIGVMRVLQMMGQDDRLLITLRRYLLRNRLDGRFYTPTWPAPVGPSGLVEYLEMPAGPARFRGRLYESLSDLPFAESELAALLQAAGPGRRDVPGLVEGLAKATRQAGTTAAVLAQLKVAQDHEALTFRDRALLIALAVEDPAVLPAELLASLGEQLLFVDPSDVETLSKLARIAGRCGDTGAARAIMRWVVASDVLMGHRSGWLDERLERLDEYLVLLPEAERAAEEARLLAGLAPTPFDAPSDEVEARRLGRLAELGDAAALGAEVEVVRARLNEGPKGNYRLSAVAVARLDAQAGRFDEFVKTLDRAVATGRNLYRARVPLDARELLPPAERLSEPGRYAAAVERCIDRHREEGLVSRGAAVQCLCLLGYWCAENGDLDGARAFGERADALAADLYAPRLWVADLARKTGDAAQAERIELELLQADALPLVRLVRLLAALEAQRGREAADAVAAGIARYSDHPVVLKRALRHAKATGDEAAASEYRDRLEHVTTTLPEQGTW